MESIISKVRELPSFFRLLFKDKGIEHTSVLSVAKLFIKGQDFWTLLCTLVNYQIKIRKFLIPMLTGLASDIKRKYNDSFYEFIFASRQAQKELLENFYWCYINTKLDIVGKKGWSHRFIKVDDLLCVLTVFKNYLFKYQSFEHRTWELYVYSSSFKQFLEFFIENFHDISFCKDCNKCIDEESKYSKLEKMFSQSKISYSTCVKRYLLFMRWMFRSDPDLGLWSFINPSELLAPIDSNVKRVMGRLGITKKDKGCVWKDVVDITRFLKKVNPEDPIYYDWVISRLGILEICNKDKNNSKCSICPLRSVCKNKNY